MEKSEEDSILFEVMKALNIKVIIYTITEAWEEMSALTVDKFWHKLLA